MKYFWVISAAAIISAGAIFWSYAVPRQVSYTSTLAASANALPATTSPSVVLAPVKPLATHLAPPVSIKGVYMTSWVAGTLHLREQLITEAKAAGVNAVVIDIKDYSGYLSFVPNDPALRALGTYQHRIADLDALTALLHADGFYVIGRVVTFQDPLVAGAHPQWAVQNGPVTKTKSGQRVTNSAAVIGTPWKDNAGLLWVDPGASGNWQYLAAIGKEAYSRGFDEINFDYVRFPSDGDVNDAVFPESGTTSPPIVLSSFFQYLNSNLRGYTEAPGQSGLKISADLFGMTTTADDDMGIGQVLDDALPYFDYVDPMVYPSHFSAGWGGFALPDSHPYDVIKIAMDSAVLRAEALAAGIIATTTTAHTPRTKSVVASIEAIPLADRLKVTTAELRPWLQDFELHSVTYTSAMIGQEMQATKDAGLPSWLMWDPNNRYTSTFTSLGH